MEPARVPNDLMPEGSSIRFLKDYATNDFKEKSQTKKDLSFKK